MNKMNKTMGEIRKQIEFESQIKVKFNYLATAGNIDTAFQYPFRFYCLFMGTFPDADKLSNERIAGYLGMTEKMVNDIQKSLLNIKGYIHVIRERDLPNEFYNERD